VVWLVATWVLARRHWATAPRRVVAGSAFVVYLAAACAIVLLPFPDAAVVAEPAPVNLEPFGWLGDAIAGTTYAGGGLGAWLTNRTVVYVLSNLLLTVPLGAVLRHRGWRPLATAAAGLALSLAFELTQLTAVWGLYPHRYRTFDVDDLLANTAGALVGWVLAPLLWALPAVRAGSANLRPGRWWQRLAAFGLDLLAWTVLHALVWLAVWSGSAAVGREVGQTAAVAVWVACGAIVFLACPLLCRGATPGSALLDLAPVGGVRNRPEVPE
jgi:glycopeptide antibiotics resistance protein